MMSVRQPPLSLPKENLSFSSQRTFYLYIIIACNDIHNVM